MQYYPQNTVAQYTTKLSNMIELDGDWEVGLTEISVPSRVENVVEGRCFFKLYLDNVWKRKLTLSPKHYKRVADVVADLNKLLSEGEVPHPTFSYNRISKKIRVQLIVLNHANSVPAIQFSPDLSILLGFDSHVTYSGYLLTAERTIDLRDNIYSTYVYCDLVECVPVGDTKAPLLRIVDNPKRVGGNVHQVMNPILYVPLQKKCFDSVEINIMTDCGLPVPFISGKSFVVLEFRRVIHPYFAI